MLRKCGLFVLSFVVLSISLSVFFSDVSRAASPYDSLYQTTNSVYLHRDGCDNIDFTQNFAEALRSGTRYQESNPKPYDSFMDAVNNGGRWGVSGYGDNGFEMYWTPDDSLYLDWTTYDGQAIVAKGNNLHQATFAFMDHSGNPSCDVNIAFYTTNGMGTVSGWGAKNLFVYTDHLNLPIGYDGPAIPSGTDDDREVIKPDFKYIVNDKSLSLTDYNQKLPDFTPDEGYRFNGYEVEWSLFKCDVSDNSPSTCLNPELSNHQILPQSTTYQYDVDEYHMYMIEAQYLVQQCYRYPSYPATPDYCFYVDLNTEFDDYRFLPTSVSLNIDGSVIIGDTKQNDCDESGYCQPKKGNDLYEYFNGRENFGLTAILLAPILFYQQLPSLAESCAPINFSWFGRPVSLPCIGNSMQIWSPTLFGIYQAVVNAFVAYYVALGIFRTIKTVNDPKEDRIEVTTL